MPSPKKKKPRFAGRPAIDWRPGYVAALAETGAYGRACTAAQVNKTTVYRERLKNPDFVAAEKEALAIATMALEDEARRRAIEGLRRYKFLKDGSPILMPGSNQPYFELEYSDVLLAMLLKAQKPEVYKDKVGMEHSGSVTHTHLTLAEFEERMKEARA